MDALPTGTAMSSAADVGEHWTAVGPVEAIPRQGARIVTTCHGDIAVFRTHDDQVFALVDRCPHRGGPLSQGMVHGHAVTCPLHNWVIALDTGRARDPDEGCVATVPVRLDRGQVLIGLAAQVGAEGVSDG